MNCNKLRYELLIFTLTFIKFNSSSDSIVFQAILYAMEGDNSPRPKGKFLGKRPTWKYTQTICICDVQKNWLRGIVMMQPSKPSQQEMSQQPNHISRKQPILPVLWLVSILQTHFGNIIGIKKIVHVDTIAPFSTAIRDLTTHPYLHAFLHAL